MMMVNQCLLLIELEAYMKNNIIYRYSLDYIFEYLKVEKYLIKQGESEKKFFEHGSIVDIEMAGNGYHGRCSNCGLALVTDLGYNSWEGTKCVKKATEDIYGYRYKWTKKPNYATKFSKEESREHFHSLLYKQGWGKYNFQEKTLDELNIVLNERS